MSHTRSSEKQGTASSQKKHKKFNFFDVLIILLVLAMIGGIVYLLSPASIVRKMSDKKEGTLSYTVEIKGVDSTYLNKIQENDPVLDSVSKGSLGTVVAVDYNTKYTVLEYTENDGQYEGVLAEYPDKYNIVVTLSVTAEHIPGEGYLVNGRRIAIGELLSLRFPDYIGEGYCVSLIAENFN